MSINLYLTNRGNCVGPVISSFEKLKGAPIANVVSDFLARVGHFFDKTQLG